MEKSRFLSQALACICLAATVLPIAMPAHAQEKAPLKVVTGFPPGGSVDVLARILAEAMRDDFSSVVVDNKPGAAGRLALNLVKNSKADGQTVIVLPMGPMVLFPHVYKKLDYDPVKDFTPISQLALSNFGIVAGPSSGAGNIREMIEKVKADPKLANYSTSGAGTFPHLLGVLLEKSAGITLNSVPFQGGAPANTALLGGHIQYKFDVVSETAALHRDGKVKIIAVVGAKRDPQVPEVPTLKEQGVNMEASVWFAMYGPAGLTPDTRARIEKSVAAALRKPDVRERLGKLGYEVTGTNGAELAAIQKTEINRWEQIVKATGVSLD